MAVSPIKAKECSYKPTREFKIRPGRGRANSGGIIARGAQAGTSGWEFIQLYSGLGSPVGNTNRLLPVGTDEALSLYRFVSFFA